MERVDLGRAPVAAHWHEMDQPIVPTTYILAAGPHGPLHVCVGQGEDGGFALPRTVTQGGGIVWKWLWRRPAPLRLVWLETHGSMAYAQARRTSLSRWSAGALRDLVARTNPSWLDLCPGARVLN